MGISIYFTNGDRRGFDGDKISINYPLLQISNKNKTDIIILQNVDYFEIEDLSK